MSQLRLITAIPTYCVCAAASLGIGAKHFLTSGRPTLAALDTAATFVLTLPLPLYMHTFTEVNGRYDLSVLYAAACYRWQHVAGKLHSQSRLFRPSHLPYSLPMLSTNESRLLSFFRGGRSVSPFLRVRRLSLQLIILSATASRLRTAYTLSGLAACR